MADELFSARHGRGRKLDQGDFAKLIWKGMEFLAGQGCFDALVPSHLLEPAPELRGIRDPEAFFLRRLKTSDVWPSFESLVGGRISHAPFDWRVHPDVLWDTLEFLHADVATYRDRETGIYYEADGRTMLRKVVNRDLSLYDPPMEMLENGQIVEQAPGEFQDLLDAPIPDDTPAPLRDPLFGAIAQYRRRDATDHDKRSALKHLADVLEPLRSEIDESILRADERALFRVANGFWIRHNDRNQQRNYDTAVWLDWMFYVYVATAKALLAVLERQELADRVYGEEPETGGGLPF